MDRVEVKNYTLPAVDERETLRYAGIKGEGEAFKPLLAECIFEGLPLVTPRVAYLSLAKEELYALIPSAKASESLAAFLEGSERVLLFAATVGLGIDRLLARYASVSPVKALFFQALGAERIERLCDEFCQGKPRFSAGYGDFPLAAQREIFRALDCPKRLGLTLTESLMMKPTK